MSYYLTKLTGAQIDALLKKVGTNNFPLRIQQSGQSDKLYDGSQEIILSIPDYVPRALFDNFYFSKIETLTANFVNVKPVANANNYLQTVTTNTTLDFNSAQKLVISRTLENDIELSKQNGISVTLSFAISRNASLEFGARVLIDDVPISSNQAFGIRQYDGDNQYTSVNDATFTIGLDAIVDTQVFNAGQVLTIEIVTRQATSQTTTARYFCGVNASGVDRNCFASLDFSNTSINGVQLTDKSVTEQKLSQELQDKINSSFNTREIIYDYASDNPDINLGYPNCIWGDTTITKDLSKYKRLKFYIKFTGVVQCITEADIFYNQTNTVTHLYRITDMVKSEGDTGSRYGFLIEIPTDRSQFTMTKIGFYDKSNTWQDRTNAQFNQEYVIYRVEGFVQ